MQYRNFTTLRRDLEAGGLLEAAYDPAVAVRGYVRDGTHHQWTNPAVGPSSMSKEQTPLSRLLDEKPARCTSAERCRCSLTQDLVVTPTALALVMHANKTVQEAARRHARVDAKAPKRIAKESAKWLSELAAASRRLLPLEMHGPDTPTLAQARADLQARCAEVEALWSAVASNGTTRDEALREARKALAGDNAERHFAFDGSAGRDVIIGVTRPAELTQIGRSLVAAFSVVETNEAGNKAILRAPAYVRDYLLSTGQTYLKAQLVEDAGLDPDVLRLAATVWEPRGDTALVNLANAIEAVLNAHA